MGNSLNETSANKSSTSPAVLFAGIKSNPGQDPLGSYRESYREITTNQLQRILSSILQRFEIRILSRIPTRDHTLTLSSFIVAHQALEKERDVYGMPGSYPVPQMQAMQPIQQSVVYPPQPLATPLTSMPLRSPGMCSIFISQTIQSENS